MAVDVLSFGSGGGGLKHLEQDCRSGVQQLRIKVDAS